jgi:hypothetical protein
MTMAASSFQFSFRANVTAHRLRVRRGLAIRVEPRVQYLLLFGNDNELRAVAERKAELPKPGGGRCGHSTVH